MDRVQPNKASRELHRPGKRHRPDQARLCGAPALSAPGSGASATVQPRIRVIPKHREVTAGLKRSDQFKRMAPGSAATTLEGIMGRGILLWLLGVPIPIIIILALLWH
jgi:hypothetical protein